MPTSHLPTQNSTSDRFQGALLGLWLVPRAIAESNRTADEWENWAAAVAFGFEHILASPAEPLSPQSAQERPVTLSTGRPIQLPLWLTDIAELLRYHDSRERRWQRFATESQTYRAQTSGTQAPAEAQYLILGDLLEFALSGCADSPVNYLVQLQMRSQPYELLSAPSRHYQGILTEMHAQLSQIWRLPAVSQSISGNLYTHDLTATELADHAAFIGGVLSALTHPESYCLSVQAAARYGGIAALAAGVLAGAISGRMALPVLWQMGLSAKSEQAPSPSSSLNQEFCHQSGNQIEKQDDLNIPLNRTSADRSPTNKLAQLSQQRLSDVSALANRLFEQWAGILPAASAPSAVVAVKTACGRSAI
ncbi:hypothetical protein [Leptolyngbya sp. BC1307]|uniref:hypothetical protein n=1 Tax=Leptolyngbya sp. BC1307 TaxID=2029589 RepID=UPI000EFADC85|nr:hypothetical protein [Leptolyngbya sp. BC1307]